MRIDEVGVIQVRPVFDEREVDPFVLAEMPDVTRGMRALVSGFQVQLAAAVVEGVGVVIRHAFTAQVVERALNDAGYIGRACL